MKQLGSMLKRVPNPLSCSVIFSSESCNLQIRFANFLSHEIFSHDRPSAANRRLHQPCARPP